MLLFSPSSQQNILDEKRHCQKLHVVHFAVNQKRHEIISELLAQASKHPLQKIRPIVLREATTFEQLLQYSQTEQINLLLYSVEQDAAFQDKIFSIRAASHNAPLVLIADDYEKDLPFSAIKTGVQDILVVGEFSGQGLARALQYAFERHQSLQHIERIEHRAQQKNSVKNQLIYQIAQEVRKTIDGVITCTGIDDKKSDLEKARVWQQLREQSLLLSTTISAALDYTQIDAGEMHAHAITFHARHYLDHLLTLLSERAAAKGYLTLTNIDASLPMFIVSDADKIWRALVATFEQILQVAEAERPIILSAWFSKGLQHTGLLHVRFALSQRELPKAKLDAIFESLNQMDLALVKKYGTTGLSLGIAATLAQVMGGKLSVRSALHQGLIFNFEVPVETR